MLGRKDFHKPFSEETVLFRGDDSSWLEEWKELVAAIEEAREPLGNGHEGLGPCSRLTPAKTRLKGPRHQAGA